MKVDEITNFGTLKWQAGMTFPTTLVFKHTVIKYALDQGDFKFNVLSATRRRMREVSRLVCKFKLYTSWDKMLFLNIAKAYN